MTLIKLSQLILQVSDGNFLSLHLLLLSFHKLHEHFFHWHLLFSRWLHPILCLGLKSWWYLGLNLLFLITSLICTPPEIRMVSSTWVIGVGVRVVLIPIVIANEVGCLSLYGHCCCEWPFPKKSQERTCTAWAWAWVLVSMFYNYLLNDSICVHRALKASICITYGTLFLAVLSYIIWWWWEASFSISIYASS